MDCSGGLQSYGRRKRSTNETEDDPPAYFRVSTQLENTPGKCTSDATVRERMKRFCKLMGIFLEAKSDESSDRSPRSTEPSILPYGGKFGSKGNLLPEHVDLGLRLTVGEDVVQKPFLPSTQARMNCDCMDGHMENSQNLLLLWLKTSSRSISNLGLGSLSRERSLHRAGEQRLLPGRERQRQLQRLCLHLQPAQHARSRYRHHPRAERRHGGRLRHLLQVISVLLIRGCS